MTAISVSAPFPILTDIDGSPLDAGHVYIGQANLDPAAFPKAAYWDASLTTPAAQPIRTTGGYPVRNGSPARIYTDGDYSIRINNKNGTLVYSSPASTDRLDSWQIGYDGGTVQGVLDVVTGPNGAASVGYLPDGAGAVATTVEQQLHDIQAWTVNVKDAPFYAKGDGITDDTAAIKSAIDFVKITGGSIYFPRGTYKLLGEVGADGITHGLHIPFSGQGIDGSSKAIILYGEGNQTKLLAGTANMVVVRWSGNSCVMRDMMIQGNGTSVGLALMSGNSTTSTPGEGITYNSFNRLTIAYCKDGVRLQSPLGTFTGVYYNNFSDVFIYYSSTPLGGQGGRGIHFYTLPGATNNQNRNVFTGIRFQRLNTAIEIEDGDTNTFYSCSFEAVKIGTLPSATPTAIKIGGGVVSTYSNRFFGATSEDCTRDLDNDNSYSEFYGCTLGILGNMVLTQQPRVWMGGYDGSVQPTIFPGWFRGLSTAGISVENRVVRDIDTLRHDALKNNASTKKFFSLGNIPANGNTKTLACVFDQALATTAQIDITVNVRFHGVYANWDASGQKLISTTFWTNSSKTSASNVVDTDVIATAGIGAAGVVTRTALNISTTQIELTYAFNAGNANPSGVRADVEVIIGGPDTLNARPVAAITFE